MNLVKLVSLAILIAFGTAIADEKIERKMEIKVVVDGDLSDDSGAVHWTSESMDFDLQDLEVGEARTIENETGKPVTVTRGEEGFTFDIDGQTIDMPDVGERAAHMAFIGTHGADHDIDIEVIGDAYTAGSRSTEGVTIISSKPLDASVRESIKSVLMSAGNNDEVIFIDGTDNAQRVMVMKKEVEITQ